MSSHGLLHFSQNFTYYSGIIPNSLYCPLFPKLFRHNFLRPNDLANTKTANRQPELHAYYMQCKYWVYVVYFRLAFDG